MRSDFAGLGAVLLSLNGCAVEVDLAPSTRSAARAGCDAVLTLSSGARTVEGAEITATAADQSAVCAEEGARLQLDEATLVKHGGRTDGAGAAVLARTGGSVELAGGSVSHQGEGAAALLANGAGASIRATSTAVVCAANQASGAATADGGTITLTDIDLTTTGARAPALAALPGAGGVAIVDGYAQTSGVDSPGIRAAGTVSVSGTWISALASDGARVEGSGTLALRSAHLTGGRRGVLIEGGALVDAAALTLDGGMVTAAAGDAFVVSGGRASIILRGGAWISAGTGVLARVSDAAHLRITADGESLAGDVVVDGGSSAAVALIRGTSLAGTLDGASLALDGSSRWTLTADSTLQGFTDAEGIAGDAITNVVGNGLVATYDLNLPANAALGGRTYGLVGGGALVPR